MAFELVAGKKIFPKWGEVGKGYTMTGIYKGTTEGKFGTNHIIEGEDAIWEMKAMAFDYAIQDGKFKVGDMIKVVYTGQAASKKKGFSGAHTFEFYVDKDYVNTEPQSEKPATPTVEKQDFDLDFEEV